MAVENEFPKVDGDILFASEVNSFGRNFAKGVIATLSGSGVTNMTNLANATDEDLTTVTGNDGGVKADGEIKWDLNQIRVYGLILIRYSIDGSLNGSQTYTIEVSPDDSAWTIIDTNASPSTGNKDFVFKLSDGIANLDNFKIRYIKLKKDYISDGGSAIRLLSVKELIVM